MPAFFTLLGILLILVAIPFGLMIAPLALGILAAYLGWKHVAAGWQTDDRSATA